MTMTEKVLARHSGAKSVVAGDNVWVNVDVLMTHDICGPATIGIFEEEFGKNAKVFDPDKVVIVPDHYIFTADTKSHRNLEILRDFAKRHQIRYFYDADFVKGEGVPKPYLSAAQTAFKGVCHVALAENGHDRPGEVLIGTDSHTCTAGAFGEFATGVGNSDAAFVMGTGKLWLKVPATMRFDFVGPVPPYIMGKDLILHTIGLIGTDGATYRAMEFAGEALMSLNIDERMTLTNMAIEAGGKNGIIAPDALALAYVRGRTKKSFEPVFNDADASYFSRTTIDVSKLEPTVAQPHSPDKAATARSLKQVKIDRSYIGSCTGGKVTDFIAAACVLKGRTVKIDTYIVPATTSVDMALDAVKVEGQSLRQIFQAAGCKIGPASCAACLGGPADTFGRANAAINVISTTNRNFPGRMGSKEAGVFLASPLTVAATALTGHVTDPREYYSGAKAVGLVQ
jgi:3-isopropylmalate/(R)-2-methylmalate dehydratase large subunit